VRGGVVFLLALVACSGKSSTASAPAPLRVSGKPETLTYAASLGVDLQLMTRTASGLYYRDSQLGRGTAAEAGSRVRVAYKGWLADGRMFDSSDDGYEFLLGRKRVISGWDEGVAGMKVGGRRVLVIPPSLAYGPMSPGGGIPPNATLVFDVRLLAVDQ
jgi:FKBP-type peptidyl-prolyl cis-trans isomerase FkpA